MNKNKQAYIRPTTDILVVRFEGAFLALSDNVYGTAGRAGADLEDGNEYDL